MVLLKKYEKVRVSNCVDLHILQKPSFCYCSKRILHENQHCSITFWQHAVSQASSQSAKQPGQARLGSMQSAKQPSIECQPILHTYMDQ